MNDKKEVLFETTIWISLGTKFIILFITLLALTISANIYYGTLFFTQDKTAYIYETGLNKSHILKSRIREIILRVVDNSITLGNVLQTSGTIKMELGNDSIALKLVNFSNGKLDIVKSIINKRLMSEVAGRYETDQETLITKSVDIFEKQLNHNKKINIISAFKELKIPILLIGIKITNNSYYLTLLNIEPLIIDLESDSLYTNIIMNDKGIPIFSKLDTANNLVNEEYIQEILKSNINNGAKKIITSDGTEKLVAFSKIPTFNLIVLTEIKTNKAFKIIHELKRKGIFFGLFILGIAVALVVLISLTITKPINKLIIGITDLASGNFSTRVKLSSHDETRVLASAFNYMASKISKLVNEMLEKARLQQEIENAKIIQDALFPDTSAEFENILVEGLYESATECSGDWWFYETIGRDVYYFIGDATGHGVPAALLTASVRATLATLDKENTRISPAIIMKKMNAAVNSTARGQLFMTFFIAKYNLDHGELIYCNASHNTPYQFNLKNDLQLSDLRPLDESMNPRLGEIPDHDYTEVKSNISKNDIILFYTDGIIEIENEKGRQLGEKKFLKILLEGINKNQTDIRKTVEFIKQEIDKFGEENVYDDDITYYISYFS